MARSALRRLGLLTPLKKLLRSKSYEDAFHTQMQAAARPGMVIWDIGANVGFYTLKFAAWAGPSSPGVVAFEPLPAAVAQLRAAAASALPNSARMLICPVALAQERGVARFTIDPVGDGITTTSHLSEDARDGNQAPTVGVQVETVDTVAIAEALPLPNLTKIDVEGYEEEVLLGGKAVFGAPASEHIFIEIHFTRLAERGRGDAPGRIVKLLHSWGYHVRWLDPSHLHASRLRKAPTGV